MSENHMILGHIETLAGVYADARRRLADLVREIESRQRRIVEDRLDEIRLALASTAEAEESLRHAIEAAPEQFDRPRTRTFHGVKVGLQKGKGKIEIDDETKTLRLIRERLPEDQAELLIKVTERVDRRMVADLTAADLKRLGIRVVESGDQVVIRPVDSDLDKLVRALLSDVEIEEAAA